MITIHFTDEKTDIQKDYVACSESAAKRRGGHFHSGLPDGEVPVNVPTIPDEYVLVVATVPGRPCSKCS